MDEKIKNILAQVSSLYMKYGIKSVTMDDVSRELGMSKKTLYEFFKDKNALVREVMEYQMNMMGEAIHASRVEGANAIDELLTISRIVKNYLSSFNPSVNYDLQKYYLEIWQVIIEYKRQHVFTNVKNNLIKGIEEGLYRSDINPEIIARLYVSRIETTMDKHFDPYHEFNTAELFRELFFYHIRGIASKKGIEYLEKNDLIN